MLRFYINDVHRTSSVELSTLRVEENLTNRGTTASFNTIDNYQPTAGQTITIYDGTFLTEAVSAGSTVSIPVYDVFSDCSKFRVGDVVKLGVETANEEEVTVSSVGVSSITVATVVNSHSAEAMIAKKIFGGVIFSCASEQVEHNQDYVTFSVRCGDHKAVMDRKLINQSFIDRKPHYILTEIINTINYTEVLDAFEYTTNGAIQAVWTESGDGGNPTTTSSDAQEGTYRGLFPWTNSGGTATFVGALTASDVSDFVGISSGAPTKGFLDFWLMKVSGTVSAITIRLGSDSSNYAQWSVSVPSDADWHYNILEFVDAAITGTPAWTALDYSQVFVTESASGSISLDGLRVNGSASYTFTNVDRDGDEIDLFTVSYKPARETVDRLIRLLGWEWWIDVDRDLHALPADSSESSPISITESSENYTSFSATPDLSQVRNKVYVRGGKEPSSSQVETIYGDGATKQFYLREKPRSIGPYLYDLTVEVSLGGGGFTTKTVGIANRDDAASYEFMLNVEEKYIVNGSHAVLAAVDRIRATFTYLVPVIVLREDNASQVALKAMQDGTDGVYEHVIVDSSITSRGLAHSFAQAELARYANALVTVSFVTYQEGLSAGQLLSINRPSHGVNDTFLIQRVAQQMVGLDRWAYSVTCASTIFGIQELFKLLLERDYKADESESVFVLKTASETITTGDAVDSDVRGAKFRWATASPTTDNAKWNMFSWA